MDLDSQHLLHPETISAAARERMLSLPREPLFIADWLGVVMIHLEVDAKALQAATPFTLDLWDGRAFVSLVAFTLRGMRPKFGGRLSELIFKPLATHRFLNMRTYVRHDGEPGIHFLAEWLNSRLAVQLGPRAFGLPYRLGQIEYENEWQRGELRGRVVDAQTGAELVYRAGSETGAPGADRGLSQAAAAMLPTDAQDFSIAGSTFQRMRVGTTRAPNYRPCAAGSRDEWLMERYTAFNGAKGGASVPASRDGGRKLVNEARADARPTSPTCRRRFFRVWHEPWPQVPVQVELADRSLLTRRWPFFREAKLTGANYSPGVRDVWMGWPHAVGGKARHGLHELS